MDATIIQTEGFGVFNDRRKLALIREMARKRGVILLTDSDGAGFVIRNHLKGMLGGCDIKQAYIPDIYGKERRKASPSKEGKLGVEGMRPEVLLQALKSAGATIDDAPSEERAGGITKADFVQLGLSGAPDSAKRREALIKKLDLPGRLSSKGLLQAVNVLYTREEFFALAETLSGSGL